MIALFLKKGPPSLNTYTWADGIYTFCLPFVDPKTKFFYFYLFYCQLKKLTASANIAAKSQGWTAQTTQTINNLLDNITPANRDHIDKRLNELEKQRQQLEIRLEEIKRLSISQAEIKGLINEAMQFIAGLKFTLKQGLPQEKLATLRQWIEKIFIDKSAEEIKLVIRQVPVGILQGIDKINYLID